tara:strand:- start:427 stop:600 length:174 start_codon:yes stop_codon:yes gene_type:complete
MILGLIVFSLLVGWFGSKRKIGFGWALALSLFLSPIIGFIIVCFSKKKDSITIVEDK